MPIEAILEASRTGLTYERLRLEAASRNIAAANVPLAAGANAMHLSAPVPGADFQVSLSGTPGLAESEIDTRAVHDPSHPLADQAGLVRYPKTDLVQEMATLLTASRGYEANVRAFNLLRGMTLQAMEIGAK